MKILYGVEGKYKDVTYICYKKLLANGKITVPVGENNRAALFGDHVYGVLKHINIDGEIYNHDEYAIIDAEPIEIENERERWWNEEGKFIESPTERLRQLHGRIALDFGSINDELPEQLMAINYIKETDTVLEIGGNIGRNSCIIGTILNDDTRLVVLESCELYAKQLEHNKVKNYFDFHIENSALSKVPLIQKEWITYVSEIVPQGYTKVNTITFTELSEKYKLQFNVLVADCEGALYQILKDEPNLLEHIKTIIIENDFTENSKKEFVHNKFLSEGFKAVYTQAGGWGPCYSCFFQVYQK